jgi:hypothetical protein
MQSFFRNADLPRSTADVFLALALETYKAAAVSPLPAGPKSGWDHRQDGKRTSGLR